jgi:hypothetical protein
MVRVDGPFGLPRRSLVHIFFEISVPSLPTPVPVRISVERQVVDRQVQWRVVEIVRRLASAG